MLPKKDARLVLGWRREQRILSAPLPAEIISRYRSLRSPRLGELEVVERFLPASPRYGTVSRPARSTTARLVTGGILLLVTRMLKLTRVYLKRTITRLNK